MDDHNERLFVLRLWEEPAPNGEGPWRMSLYNPATGVRLHFATLSALLAYLNTRLDRDADGHHLQS